MKRILFGAVLLLCTAATGAAQDIPLSQILVQNEGWHVCHQNLPGTFELHGLSDGRVSVVGSTSGVFSSEGKFVPNPPIQQPKDPQFSISPYLAPHLGASRGLFYTIVGNDRILRTYKFPETGGVSEKLNTVNLKELGEPTCLAIWPGEAQLVIGDAGGKFLWTVWLDKDGKPGTPDRYYSLRVKPGEKGSGVTAIEMDARNLLYAATPLGVQVFDPTGRLCGVILPPSNEKMTAITIGGKDANQLFIACGDKIYSRKIQGKATYTLKKDK